MNDQEGLLSESEKIQLKQAIINRLKESNESAPIVEYKIDLNDAKLQQYLISYLNKNITAINEAVDEVTGKKITETSEFFNQKTADLNALINSHESTVQNNIAKINQLLQTLQSQVNATSENQPSQLQLNQLGKSSIHISDNLQQLNQSIPVIQKQLALDNAIRDDLNTLKNDLNELKQNNTEESSNLFKYLSLFLIPLSLILLSALIYTNSSKKSSAQPKEPNNVLEQPVNKPHQPNNVQGGDTLNSSNANVRSDELGSSEVDEIIQGDEDSLTAVNEEITYTVKSGDSFYRIAKKHNITVDEIYNLNGLDASYSLRAGETLIISQPSQQ